MDLLERPIVIEIFCWILFSAILLAVNSWRQRRAKPKAPLSPVVPRTRLAFNERQIVNNDGVSHDDFDVRRRHLAPTDGVVSQIPASFGDDSRAVAADPHTSSRKLSPKWRPFIITLLFFSGIGYLLTLGLVVGLYRWQENAFLYSGAVPCKNVTEFLKENDACDYDLGVENSASEDIFLPVSAGSFNPIVHVWWIRGLGQNRLTNPTLSERRLTVFISHGSVENVAAYKSLYIWLSHELGLDVVAWDYPGFGKSSGSSEEGVILTSAETVMRHLTEARGISIEDVVLWGYSLGGPVVTHLAAVFPAVAGVVLQAPMDSAADVLRNDLPLTGWATPLLLTQPYDTKSTIGSLKTCLFLFVGTEDDRFSVERERALFDVAVNVDPACSRFVTVQGLGHMQCPLTNEGFRNVAKDFLEVVSNRRSDFSR